MTTVISVCLCRSWLVLSFIESVSNRVWLLFASTLIFYWMHHFNISSAVFSTFTIAMAALKEQLSIRCRPRTKPGKRCFYHWHVWCIYVEYGWWEHYPLLNFRCNNSVIGVLIWYNDSDISVCYESAHHLEYVEEISYLVHLEDQVFVLDLVVCVGYVLELEEGRHILVKALCCKFRQS